ncbi:MAG: hypothetical protein HYU52_05160 [Acidobacteria bacterium]|nr:hypothetical protein [Acidobacteriota bacterium]
MIPVPEMLPDAVVPAGGKVRVNADWLLSNVSIVIGWANAAPVASEASAAKAIYGMVRVLRRVVFFGIGFLQ